MGEPLKPGHYPGIAQSPVGEAIRAGHLPGGAEGAAMKERWEKLQEEKKNAKHVNVLLDQSGLPQVSSKGVKGGKG